MQRRSARLEGGPAERAGVVGLGARGMEETAEPWGQSEESRRRDQSLSQRLGEASGAMLGGVSRTAAFRGLTRGRDRADCSARQERRAHRVAG